MRPNKEDDDQCHRASMAIGTTKVLTDRNNFWLNSWLVASYRLSTELILVNKLAYYL